MTKKIKKSWALPETEDDTKLLTAAFNLMAQQAYVSGGTIFSLTDTPREQDANQIMLYASGDAAKQLIAFLDTMSSNNAKLADRAAVEDA